MEGNYVDKLFSIIYEECNVILGALKQGFVAVRIYNNNKLATCSR